MAVWDRKALEKELVFLQQKRCRQDSWMQKNPHLVTANYKRRVEITCKQIAEIKAKLREDACQDLTSELLKQASDAYEEGFMSAYEREELMIAKKLKELEAKQAKELFEGQEKSRYSRPYRGPVEMRIDWAYSDDEIKKILKGKEMEYVNKARSIDELKAMHNCRPEVGPAPAMAVPNVRSPLPDKFFILVEDGGGWNGTLLLNRLNSEVYKTVGEAQAVATDYVRRAGYNERKIVVMEVHSSIELVPAPVKVKRTKK